METMRSCRGNSKDGDSIDTEAIGQRSYQAEIGRTSNYDSRVEQPVDATGNTSSLPIDVS